MLIEWPAEGLECVALLACGRFINAASAKVAISIPGQLKKLLDGRTARITPTKQMK